MLLLLIVGHWHFYSFGTLFERNGAHYSMMGWSAASLECFGGFSMSLLMVADMNDVTCFASISKAQNVGS
jgi:hypothetical protein